MKTQFTVDKEFIKEAYNSACPDWKDKLKNKFPEAFQIDLEVGKWYKWHGGILHITKIVGNSAWFYGVDEYGYWRKKDWYSKSHEIRPELATDKEVETALIAEAKRRGYRNGVTFKSLDYNFKNVKIIDDFLKFDFNNNDLYLKVDAPSGQRYRSVFLKGKWAEIISEQIEVTLEQIAEKFNVNVEQLKIKK